MNISLQVSMGKYTARPKSKTHLDLTNQIGKSLPWITTAWMIMFQLATSYLTLTDAVIRFSFLKQPCQKTHPVVMEKMLICFRRVKLLACTKQIKHLRRWQKQWIQKCGLKKSWLIVIGDHLNFWWNQIIKKQTVEPTAMFNSERKSISTCTMRRELKGLGLNSCVALRRPLISEANREKKASIC